MRSGSGARAGKITPILEYLAQEFPAPRFTVGHAPEPEQLAERFSITTEDLEVYTLLVRRSWFDAYAAHWRIAEALQVQEVAARLRAAGTTTIVLRGG